MGLIGLIGLMGNIGQMGYILWNPSLSFGPFRWYSLCWLIGLLLA